MLIATSVLQNFWCNLPLKKSILKNQTNTPGTYLRSMKLRIKKWIKHPQGFTKLYLCQFSDRLNHLCLLYSAPKVFCLFSVYLSPLRPKIIIFKKKKRPPKIYHSYKCVKFQTDLAIYAYTNRHTHLSDFSSTEVKNYLLHIFDFMFLFYFTVI